MLKETKLKLKFAVICLRNISDHEARFVWKKKEA